MVLLLELKHFQIFQAVRFGCISRINTNRHSWHQSIFRQILPRSLKAPNCLSQISPCPPSAVVTSWRSFLRKYSTRSTNTSSTLRADALNYIRTGMVAWTELHCDLRYSPNLHSDHRVKKFAYPFSELVKRSTRTARTCSGRRTYSTLRP